MKKATGIAAAFVTEYDGEDTVSDTVQQYYYPTLTPALQAEVNGTKCVCIAVDIGKLHVTGYDDDNDIIFRVNFEVQVNLTSHEDVSLIDDE